jgi:hypothetical protein
MGAIIWGGIALHARGRVGLAKAVLAVVAVPTVLFFLFFLTLILTQPRWN